jgi:hypothetical protein
MMVTATPACANRDRGRPYCVGVRDALGVLLVAVGLGWTLVSRDELGLVIAFAGVTLLACGVLRPHRRTTTLPRLKATRPP